MTITEQPELALLAAITCDLYRDIHKGIRAELFAVTGAAGRLDPVDRHARAALAERIGGTARLLVEHAEHEDGAIQPVLERELPALAPRIAEDHERIDGLVARLPRLAAAAVEADPADARHAVHALYLELASFTATYLEHQDVEERVVMPALQQAVGVEAVVGIHQAIIGAIPPDEMARSLAVMIPAMNVDGRVELLGGMQAGAPAEVFAGVWGLAGSVLTPAEHGELAERLGIA